MIALSHQPCKQCSSSDAMALYEDGSEHCFSCGYHKGSAKKKTKAVKACTASIIKQLPLDFTPYLDDMPKEARVWILKYLHADNLHVKYNIGYSPLWDRVIIPSYRDSVLLGWQGRAIHKHQQVKYIQGKGQYPLLFYSRSAQNNNREKPIVIVEDAVSAMVVGEVLPAIALLTTKLDSDNQKLFELLNLGKEFIMWLDPDDAGQKASNALQKRLELFAKCATINNKEAFKGDPKTFTKEQLRWFLLGVRP